MLHLPFSRAATFLGADSKVPILVLILRGIYILTALKPDTEALLLRRKDGADLCQFIL